MTNASSTVTEYDTCGPARIEVDVDFGAVRLVTGPRSTTSVTVGPATSSRRADTELAASTGVDFVGGVVSVAIPRRRILGSLWRPGAIDVLIEAPAGSSVRAATGYAPFVAEGTLRQCHIRSSYGDVRIDEVDDVQIKTSGGHVSVGVTHGETNISNSYGPIRVGDARGRGDLANSAGDISVATARGTLSIRSAYGQITVGNALSGSLDVVTSYGATDVGVAAGTAVRLDVHTKNGRVVNALTPTGGPREPASVLTLRVRSGWGDVMIRRTTAAEGGNR